MYAKNTKRVNVEPLLLPTYLAFVKASVGSRLFERYYAKVNGKKTEVLRGGRLSCAVHLTSILKIFSLIPTVELTVHRTLDALERTGWRKTRRPKPGDIVVWQEKPADLNRMQKDKNTYYPASKHLGFYVGRNKTVTNDGNKTRRPRVFPLRYRPVLMFLTHPKLH